ncbi:PREDICTED: potassium voltage-gated channel subfamily G member 1 [Myotis davidii]|uniref:potassium voltage-gated channel subfamily G member 1 n=1 Tax=Myotis davidii TaxID=225400 RepID=UPI0003EBBB79|nr:PREDICTED: potassium voltage-gated channel subfamily G member 1 [Myotis davidii]
MTLLPGDNSDYDYSALSCTSDASSHPAFFPQSQSLKGVFYRRAQRLRPQDEPRQAGLPEDRRRRIIINVGGIKYSLPWTTLEEFPMTRLGQLKACTNFDDILNVCDDYDVTCNEFFFDRNPGAFGTILTFLRAGKLRLLREMCALSFQEELLYWGIAEDHLDGCCKRRYLQKMEEFAEMVEREDEEDPLDSDSQDSEGLAEGDGHRGHCMRRLRDMVERPHSGLPGKVFACLSVLFVTITAVNLSISTLPSLREEEEQGQCSQMCHNVFIVESVCVGWFSLEFLLRFIQAPNKFAFLRSPLTLGLTARRCTREFGLLLLFLCVAIALFAPLLYVIENEMADSPEFTSIPACYWWAVITMTTVGYGDMVPRSTPGQVVALSSILSGILLMAFPVTSIFHTFSRSYLELKQEQERVMFRRTQFLIKTKSQLSGLSQDSDILFGSASSDTRDKN